MHGKKRERQEGQRGEASATLEWSSSRRAPFYTVIHLGCHIVWARREMRHGASFPREYFIPHDLSTSLYDPEQLSGTCVSIGSGSHLCEKQLY